MTFGASVGLICVSLSNRRMRLPCGLAMILSINSLAIISLVAELEEEFDITIPTVEIIPENFNSAAAMWDMITRLSEEG